MKKSVLCTLALTILFTGCAPMIWDKSGGTQAEYNRDSYECEKDARQSGYYGSGLSGALELKEFFKRCMVSRGYTLRIS